MKTMAETKINTSWVWGWRGYSWTAARFCGAFPQEPIEQRPWLRAEFLSPLPRSKAEGLEKMKESKTPMGGSRDRFRQGLERVPVQVRAGTSHMRRLRLSDCPIAGTGAGSTAFPAVERGEARRCFGVP